MFGIYFFIGLFWTGIYQLLTWVYEPILYDEYSSGDTAVSILLWPYEILREISKLLYK